MKGEGWLLSNYLKRELMVLFYVINKNETSTDEISQNLSISKRAVKETISTINQHFVEYQNIEKFILIEKTGIIQIRSELKSNALSDAYELKLCLLKNTALFNYCVLLVTRSSITKDEIMEELFISLSYLNKLTQQLNQYFSAFGFGVTNTELGYCLEGNEINIRLFSYLFLQDSFQDIDWPFPTITIKSIYSDIPSEILVDSHKRSNSKNRSLSILYAVLKTRIKKQNYTSQPKAESMQSFFSIIQENFDIALIFQKDTFGSLNIETKATEIHYFNFLFRVFNSDVIPKSEKVELGKIFFEADHPYCTLSKDILAASSGLIHHELSDRNKYLFVYFITLFNVLFFLIGDAVDGFTNLFIPPLSFRVNAKDEYMTAIKNKIASFTDNKSQFSLLASLLYTLYTSELKPEIKIYLQMSKDFTSSFFIENRLNNFFNNNQIIITDNYSLADIVVTDTLERSTSTLNNTIFYLDSISNETCWNELLSLIQRAYSEKQNIQKERAHL